MKTLITENTGMSLTVVGALIGGIVWLSFMAAKADTNAKDIAALSQQMTGVSAMQADVAVIRNKVENIERQVFRRK